MIPDSIRNDLVGFVYLVGRLPSYFGKAKHLSAKLALLIGNPGKPIQLLLLPHSEEVYNIRISWYILYTGLPFNELIVNEVHDTISNKKACKPISKRPGLHSREPHWQIQRTNIPITISQLINP